MSSLPNPLAGYEDWPSFARQASRYVGSDTRAQTLADVLGVFSVSVPCRFAVEEEWTHAGTSVAELSWSVGFGPTTRAWLVRPQGATEVLPGIAALHPHGVYKWLGAEQLVDCGVRASVEARALRQQYYDGLAPATELARRGYVVLAHDTFSWGSRRFPLEDPGAKVAVGMTALEAWWRELGKRPTEAERYNAAAALHEDSVAKAAGILGTTFAGTVLYDDLVALEVLSQQPGVDARRLGCFGLSGGGVRAALLAALQPRIGARIVTCMMSTFDSLMPAYLDTHSWLFSSPGLRRVGEWPEHAAAEAQRPLLVQYGVHDALFPVDGMRAADASLRSLFAASNAYRGTFYDAPHAFDASMQAEAWAFFDESLGRPG